LQWITSKKKPHLSQVPLTKVDKILFGFKSKLFTKRKRKYVGREDLCATIMYRGGPKEAEKDLNLLFKDRLQAKEFITGLQFFIIKSLRPCTSK
jgi:hypothetical protein